MQLTETATRNAPTFLGVLKFLSLGLDWVEPNSDGSVILEVKWGEVFQDGDFYPEGVVAVLHKKAGLARSCKLHQNWGPAQLF
jgi:hypothetical protein